MTPRVRFGRVRLDEFESSRRAASGRDVDAHEGPRVRRRRRRPLLHLRVPASPATRSIKRLDLADAATVSVVVARRQRRQRHDPRPRRPAARVRAGHARRARADQRRSIRATGERRPWSTSWHGRPFNSPNDVVVAQRRLDLVHRPQLRLPAGLPPGAARRRLRLPLRPGYASARASSPTRSTSPTGSRSRPTSRSSTSPTTARRPAATLEAPTTSSRATGCARERLFAGVDARHPDGIEVDAEGRVYASCPAGVQVLAPDGGALDRSPFRRRELRLRRA